MERWHILRAADDDTPYAIQADNSSSRLNNPLSPLSRLRRCTRSRAIGPASKTCHYHCGKCVGGAKVAGRNIFLCTRAKSSSATRLGNIAVRQFLSPPRPDFRTPRNPLSTHERRLRYIDRAGHHRPISHAAAGIPRRPYLFPKTGGNAQSRRVAQPNDLRGLQPRYSSTVTRGI